MTRLYNTLGITEDLAFRKTFSLNISRANRSILELLNILNLDENLSVSRLFGLTENQVDSFSTVSTFGKERLTKCMIPLFRMHFSDKDFTATVVRKQSINTCLEQLKALMKRKNALDSINPDDFPIVLKQRILKVNANLIEIIEMALKAPLPQCLAMFAIHEGDMLALAEMRISLRHLARAGFPLFNIIPLWIGHDLERNDCFLGLWGKMLSVYLGSGYQG